MTPLLCIDTKELRARRYIYREHGMGIVRLEMSDEVFFDLPLEDSIIDDLEAFRNPPPRRHDNVPPTGRLM